MQVRGLPRHVIRSACTASRLAAKPPDSVAASREDALRRWKQARADGLTAAQAARAVGASRASLYRWQKRPEPRSRRPHRVRRTSWTSELVQAVEGLRLDYPMWGRAKLGPLLRAQGFSVSDATVGRILAHLIARGAVEPVASLRRRRHAHRWSPRRRHALRLPKGLKADQPGALVQIDTLTVSLAPGVSVKHFTAYCPVAKWIAAAAGERATARAAARFLDKVLAEMPFPVRAIQVDGGSEFMADFEAACAERRVRLYVLPPKCPQLNGAVERAQSTWRYEFYATYELPHRIAEISPLIDSFAHLYNHHRPHGALGGLTPAQYLQSRSGGAPPSHMS